MSNFRFGQSITWGLATAPLPFTGVVRSYNYGARLQRQPIDNAAGDIEALALHSKKAELNFEAEVRSGSSDFLDLKSGAAVVVSGISTGIILATRAVERWRLLQPKTLSLAATHYPDMVQASPALAGTTLNAVTPTQSLGNLLTPGGTLVYSTAGLTHAAGVIHELTLTQELQISEDEPSPAGTILGATAYGYLRTISLLLLAQGAIPALHSTLVLTGAPAHAQDYKIESAEELWADKRGKMYQLGAVWIDPFTTS